MDVSTSARVLLVGESIETGEMTTLCERTKSNWDAGSEQLCLEVLQDALSEAARFRNKSLMILLTSDDPNVRPALSLSSDIISLMAQLDCTLDFDPHCEPTSEIWERFLQGITEDLGRRQE